MYAVRLLLCFFLLVVLAPAQVAKPSAAVRHSGTDAVGALLTQALQSELRKSGYPDAHRANSGFRHFVELVTLDAGGTKDAESSFVSVVISSMTPGGWPTPDQWYHKVMLVKRAEVPQIAARLVKDMQASWCNEITSSLSPCPAEEPWPGQPQTPDNRPVSRPRVKPAH